MVYNNVNLLFCRTKMEDNGGMYGRQSMLNLNEYPKDAYVYVEENGYRKTVGNENEPPPNYGFIWMEYHSK